MIPSFRKSRYEPKPLETDYWIDLNENEFGGVVKYYDWNRKEWKYPVTITTEKEPLFVNSPAYNITDEDILNWNSRPDTTELENKFEELELELKDLIDSIYFPENVVTLDALDSAIGSVEDKLNDKADITSVYTIDEVNALIPTIPTKVSAFENDSKYITESNLEDKLPENIVSDADYVHTDNNFTTELKDKLTNLDPDASNYDDTAVRNLIKDNTDSIRELNKKIDSLNSSVSDINSSINDINNSLDTKADKATVDAMYTNEELDLIFTKFVTKTHRSYGFCDERPTDDLTIEDTGFIFYDYTANEPLIWVTNEWRVLRQNKVLSGLNNIIMAEDQYETIGDWEYNTTDDYRFCKLTNFIGTVSNTLDFHVPNIYNGFFAISVGEENAMKYKPLERRKMTTGSTYTLLDGTQVRYDYTFQDPDYDYYSRGSDLDSTMGGRDSINNVFGVPCMIKTINDDGTINATFGTEKTAVNSLQLSSGIKNIGDFAFYGLTLPVGLKLVLPSGCNKIGYAAFKDTNIDEVEFPKNPVTLGPYAFHNSGIKKLLYSKNINSDYESNTNAYMFSSATYNSSSSLELEIEEGTEYIPRMCFRNSHITNSVVFPRSLKEIHYGAFYDTRIPGEFSSNKLLKIGGWTFRYNRLTRIAFESDLRVIAPYAFYNRWDVATNGGPDNKETILANGIEKIGYGALWVTNLFVTNNITLPPSLKELNLGLLYCYANIPAGNPDFQRLPNINLSIEMGNRLEYIGGGSMSAVTFSGILTLPESLKFIGNGALFRSAFFENTSLKIPNSVKHIGGEYKGETWGKSMYYYNNIDKFRTHSKNGYGIYEIKNYVEDGGLIVNFGINPFAGFARDTLTAFEVDEDNQYFKVIDGVLFTKDGTRAIAYPNAKDCEVYEVPEGVTQFDSDFLFGVGYPEKCMVMNDDGVEIEVAKQAFANFNNEVKLRKLVLPNSFIIKSGLEMAEEYPTIYSCYTKVMSCFSNLQTACMVGCDIQEYAVKEDNPNYTTVDGCIYTKDMKTLLEIPKFKRGTVNIPEGVERIELCIGALFDFLTEHDIDYFDGVAITTATFGSYESQAPDRVQPLGLNIHIPASVTYINKSMIRILSGINARVGGTCRYCSVTIDENNPNYTINPGNKYIVEK